MIIVTYMYLTAEINHGTDENPDIERVFIKKEMRFNTEEQLNNALHCIQAEAYNGEYTIEDEGQPEPIPEPTVWDELDAAYAAGYDEGYTEGVNTAYDQ